MQLFPEEYRTGQDNEIRMRDSRSTTGDGRGLDEDEMKLILNTTKGPAVLCDDCYEGLDNKDKMIVEDITGKIPPEHPCDRCGIRAVMPFEGNGGVLTINGKPVADVIDISGFFTR